jgi:CRP-like cAMP-binding protein
VSADGTFGKRHVGEGDLIYMEGDPGTETFLIQSGRVELVRRASDGLFETIATLGPGQVFGELALASDAPRKEGARALADCLLIAVKRDRIEASLYSADPFVAARTSRCATIPPYAPAAFGAACPRRRSGTP